MVKYMYYDKGGDYKKMKKKILIFFIIILTSIAFNIYNNKVFATEKIENKDYVYLSDILYIKNKSFSVNNHSICLDKNDSNGLITLNINNTATPFIKGICAWATSEIVYDLSSYNYDYFTSYIGVDVSEQSNYFNTGAKFYIYISNDGENWEQQYQSETLYGWSEAQSTAVKQVANALLGNIDTTIANFSFDGENAGKNNSF